MGGRDHPRTSTDQLEELALRLFSLHLKPPRVPNPPKPPALAASKLPPPCAEVDDRPNWRIRRFRLWKDSVPPLLLTVLDPERRGHLTRYQSYANPTTTAYVRGIKAWEYTPPHKAPPPVRPLVLPRTPYTFDPNLKIPKSERKTRFQRLLQYKYALDQEHERRFRRGMRILIRDVLNFERGLPQSHLPHAINKPQDEGVDVEEAVYLTRMFKDIRKKSINIYAYLAQAHVDIQPVARREELHKEIKAEEKRKEKRQAKREQERLAREQAAIAPVHPAFEHDSLPDQASEAEEELRRIAEQVKETKPRIQTLKRIKNVVDSSPEELTDASTASSVSVTTPSERSRPALRSWQTQPVGQVPTLRAPVPRRVHTPNLPHDRGPGGTPAKESEGSPVSQGQTTRSRLNALFSEQAAANFARRPTPNASSTGTDSLSQTHSASPSPSSPSSESGSGRAPRHTLLLFRTPHGMDKTAVLHQRLPQLMAQARLNPPSRPVSASISELPTDSRDAQDPQSGETLKDESDLSKENLQRRKKTHDRRRRRKAAKALRSEVESLESLEPEIIPRLSNTRAPSPSSYSTESEDQWAKSVVDHDDSDLPTTQPSHISLPYADLNRDVDTALHPSLASTEEMDAFALTSEGTQSGSDADSSLGDTYRPHPWDLPLGASVASEADTQVTAR